MTESARRSFRGKILVIASHNEGKFRHFQSLFAPLGVRLLSAYEADLEEPEETGSTFHENAILKARFAAETSGLPCLADDSGLCVTALDGAPGIYSARWAGPEKDFNLAMKRVEDALIDLYSEGPKDLSAIFRCVLALAWPDGHTELSEGVARGQLVFPPRGTHGFGYDPIFVPQGKTKTFGEMTPEEKAPLTHRAQAFSELSQRCLESVES